jgi:hypothetical protein
MTWQRFSQYIMTRAALCRIAILLCTLVWITLAFFVWLWLL